MADALGAVARGLLSRTPDALVPVVGALDARRRRQRRRAVDRWARQIESTEALSAHELAEWQLARLREQLRHAHESVPFYRRAFDSVGAHPDDVRCLDDLAALPTTTKNDLQTHLAELLATDVESRDRYYFTTGGSTGLPVGFYHDAEQPAREWAFIRALWRRVGYRDGDTSAVLRGAVVPGGRLWKRDPLRSALIVSSYHLVDERMPEIVARIRSFRPSFLQAYPSSATLVARYMLEAGEEPIAGVRAVLCGSESLYPWQRALISEAFACRVFTWYGQSEAVCLAGECESDARLHVFPQYGVVELLDEEGRRVTEPGRAGEVVATGLGSRAMPLIRYRTMDVAVLGESACSGCGRPYQLLERVEGRAQEFLVSGSGRPISMTAVNMHSAVFDAVRQFRFVQSVPGHVVLKIVPKATFAPERDGPNIVAELAPKLGEDTTISLELVDEISRAPSGKFHFIDQELPSPYAAPP